MPDPLHTEPSLQSQSGLNFEFKFSRRQALTALGHALVALQFAPSSLTSLGKVAGAEPVVDLGRFMSSLISQRNALVQFTQAVSYLLSADNINRILFDEARSDWLLEIPIREKEYVRPSVEEINCNLYKTASTVIDHLRRNGLASLTQLDSFRQFLNPFSVYEDLNGLAYGTLYPAPDADEGAIIEWMRRELKGELSALQIEHGVAAFRTREDHCKQFAADPSIRTYLTRKHEDFESLSKEYQAGYARILFNFLDNQIGITQNNIRQLPHMAVLLRQRYSDAEGLEVIEYFSEGCSDQFQLPLLAQKQEYWELRQSEHVTHGLLPDHQKLRLQQLERELRATGYQVRPRLHTRPSMALQELSLAQLITARAKGAPVTLCLYKSGAHVVAAELVTDEGEQFDLAEKHLRALDRLAIKEGENQISWDANTSEAEVIADLLARSCC